MPEPSQRRVAPALPETVLMRRVFTVEVIWQQPVEQTYTDDWGAVIGGAIQSDGTALYDLATGPVELLTGEAVPDR